MAKKDVLLLTLDQVVEVEGYNVREDMGDIKGLAQQILEANEIRQPLSGFATKDKTKKGDTIYAIRAGHRRLAALRLLHDKGDCKNLLIPVLPSKRGMTALEATLDLVISNDGKPLNMLEQAEVFRRLQEDHEMKPAEIARKSGKSQTHIADCIILLRATPAVKRQIHKNEVSATEIVRLLRDNDEQAVEQAVNEAKKESGGKKITKKHLSKTDAGKKVESVKKSSARKSPVQNQKETPNVVGEDATMSKLEKLEGILEEQDAPRNKEAFAVFSILMKYLRGKVKPDVISKTFFFPEEEKPAFEEDEEDNEPLDPLEA